MDIQLNVEDPQDLLTQAAEKQGVTVAQYCQVLVEREITRLWHIERSKPRVRNPIGRPKLDAHIKQIRELATSLRDVYLKLRQFYPPDVYAEAYAAQEAVLEQAIAEENLDALVAMNAEQPWVRRQR